MPQELLKADGDQYLRLAFHLVRHGVFSRNSYTDSEPSPTAYRLPGYPVFIALWMKLSPDLKSPDLTSFLSEKALPGLLKLIHIQIFLYFLITLGCGLMVFLITRSLAATHVSVFLVGFDRILWDWSRHVTLEVLLCFLIVAVTLTFLLCVVRGKLVWHAVSGVSLAMLCLSRGQFQYFLPIGVIFLLINTRRRGLNWRKPILGLCIFSLIPLFAVQAWKARNYEHFGRWYLTDRGGVILDIRAGLNMVSSREYRASFLYYSRFDYLERLLKKHFKPEEYRRLNRDENNPVSIYQNAKRRREQLLEQYGSMGEADKIQLSEALKKIRAHPVKHLLMCLPLAMRGFGGVVPFAMGLGALGLLAAHALFRRRWDVGAVLLPSLFSYGFCTALTHNVARYNIPIVPMVYVSLVLIGYFGYERVMLARREKSFSEK